MKWITIKGTTTAVRALLVIDNNHIKGRKIIRTIRIANIVVKNLLDPEIRWENAILNYYDIFMTSYHIEKLSHRELRDILKEQGFNVFILDELSNN